MAKKTEEVKPLTNKDILLSQGLVEVRNPDGSKSQITVEEARKRLEAQKELEATLSEIPEDEEVIE